MPLDSFTFVGCNFQSTNFGWQSSAPLKHYGLDVLLKLLKDSIANRTSCSRAGLLSFLLDWFVIEDNDDMISKIAQLIQVIGGHSISGKDIRKIFALLRSDKIRCSQFYSSLLLSTVSFMLKEKGPEAFFEFSGYDSVCLHVLNAAMLFILP